MSPKRAAVCIYHIDILYKYICLDVYVYSLYNYLYIHIYISTDTDIYIYMRIYIYIYAYEGTTDTQTKHNSSQSGPYLDWAVQGVGLRNLESSEPINS